MSSPQKPYLEYEGRGLTGLANLGNTCFMNSALQCLSHSYNLNNFLRTGNFKKKLNKRAESLILLEWDKLRELIWSENCVISPGGFLHSIQRIARIKDAAVFTGFQQNDVGEFLQFIIDCFHNSIKREVKMTISGSIVNSFLFIFDNSYFNFSTVFCKSQFFCFNLYISLYKLLFIKKK